MDCLVSIHPTKTWKFFVKIQTHRILSSNIYYWYSFSDCIATHATGCHARINIKRSFCFALNHQNDQCKEIGNPFRYSKSYTNSKFETLWCISLSEWNRILKFQNFPNLTHPTPHPSVITVYTYESLTIFSELFCSSILKYFYYYGNFDKKLWKKV